MKKPEKDLTDFLFEEGHSEFAEIIKEYRRKIIKVCPKAKETQIAIGDSKFGGYPDLPPEIPYPTMSGYICHWGNQSNRYEKSAMQLIAQINLTDIAEYDSEKLLPHTGMLYFFWSGEIMPIHVKNRYCESIADHPDNADYYKVIWYNGDLSKLRRTAPPIPYYSKYFTEAFAEKPICFGNDTDYEPLGNVLDKEQYDVMRKIAPEYDIDYLCYSSNKLLGYPSGANTPYIDKNIHMLMQYDYSVGCIWNIFWLISDEDLRKRDFSKALFSVDMD